MIEWHMPCGSFTVKSISIGMGNMNIVQKVFLTRPIVKHIRSSAYTGKSVRCVDVRDGSGRPIRSQIPGPISDRTSRDQDIRL